jgi:hypothetical protein
VTLACGQMAQLIRVEHRGDPGSAVAFCPIILVMTYHSRDDVNVYFGSPVGRDGYPWKFEDG